MSHRDETPEERAKRRAAKQRRVAAHTHSVLHKQSEFICNIRYDNELPDIPLEPKLILQPSDMIRVHEYNSLVRSAVEMKHAHDIHLDSLSSIPIEIGIGAANEVLEPENRPELDETDKEITSDRYKAVASRRDQRKKLERPAYFVTPQVSHSDIYDQVYRHADQAKAAPTPVADAEQEEKELEKMKQGMVAKTRLQRVVQSFEDVKSGELRHPTDPRKKPVRVWNVLPNSHFLDQLCITAAFDTDPEKPLQKRKLELQTGNAMKRARLGRSVLLVDADAQTAADGLTAALCLQQSGNPDKSVHYSHKQHFKLVTRKLETGSLLLIWGDDKVEFAPIGSRMEVLRSGDILTAASKKDVLAEIDSAAADSIQNEHSAATHANDVLSEDDL